jgi:hypothetical protein
MLNEDYKEMLQLLSSEGVRFLLVGAYALGAHGYPRATGDIDVWVDTEPTNTTRLMKVLKKFGAPLKGISEKDFQKKDMVFQIGVAPRRIDIITSIDGVLFHKAYEDKDSLKIDGLVIPVLSLKGLIKNKESTGREKDLLDVQEIKKRKKRK